MHEVAVVELAHQRQPRLRDIIEPDVQQVLVAELIPLVVPERVPVAGERHLVQLVRDQFVGLIDRSDQSKLAPSELDRRLGHLTSAVGLVVLAGRQLDTKPRDHHAAQGRQHVVLGRDGHVAKPVVRKRLRIPLAGHAAFAEAVYVLVLPVQERNIHLQAEAIRHPVVQVHGVGLGDGLDFLMMIQNQQAICRLDRGDDARGAVLQAHGGIVVDRVDGQQALLRHLLLRPDDDETCDGPTGGLRGRCCDHAKRNKS